MATSQYLLNYKMKEIDIKVPNIGDFTDVEECLSKTEGPIMAASDYMRMNSDQIRPYTLSLIHI